MITLNRFILEHLECPKLSIIERLKINKDTKLINNNYCLCLAMYNDYNKIIEKCKRYIIKKIIVPIYFIELTFFVFNLKQINKIELSDENSGIWELPSDYGLNDISKDLNSISNKSSWIEINDFLNNVYNKIR